MKNYLKQITKSKSAINTELKTKKNEDLSILKSIDKLLLIKRHYIFKIPPPKTSVIILATGGLDSVIATFILLEFYKLKLYPLFINWGQKNLIQEKKAFCIFIKYFKKRYPKLYQIPKYITSNIPPKEINETQCDVVTLRNTSFANHAVSYAKYLKNTKKINIRTIFLNTVATDGVMCPDTTLTAIRTTNLNICVNENDFSWQISSLAIEQELGFYFNKEDLIPIAYKFGIPLEKTWSCYQSGKVQCGTCFTCWGRKTGFKKAKIIDKTPYLKASQIELFKKKLINKINSLKHKLHAKCLPS